MSAWRTWCVRFSVRDFYTVAVKARSEEEALARAEDLYDRYGECPEKGFALDLSEGGTDNWEAEQVPCHTDGNGAD